MSRILPALLLCATPLAADPPKVVADIAPVHALVATVMDGVGAPDLLIPAAVSPHDVQLKPSQARSLMQADLVIWIGPELAPWLERALEAGDTQDLALLGVPNTQLYDFREAALFDDADHADHDDHAEGEGHSDHDDHDDHAEDADHAEDDHDTHAADDAHDAHDDHDDHAEGESHDAHDDHEDHAGHDHDAHDHDGIDPHAWLDPVNAAVWLGALAEVLAGMDPQNAATYHQNAERGQAELAALTADIDAALEPARGVGLLAFHDAYQYFEQRFGLTMVGSITPADDSDPGPARVAAIRDATNSGDIVCAFTEPQYNSGLLQAVTEETDLPVAVLDPRGSDLEVGPGLYAELLMQMSDSITTCLSEDHAGIGE